LNYSEFWTYVRQYGTTAIKMGPKVLGMRIELKQAEQKSDYKYEDVVIDSYPQLIPLTNKMNLAEATAARIQNTRVRSLERIKSAMDLADAQRRELQEKLKLPKVGLGLEAPDNGGVFEEIAPLSCPRYKEISQYLLANRRQGKLCLDTMKFEIAENTLLNYILELGGLVISPEEWRDFLRVSEAKQGEFFL
jgi:hypothetical protein